MVASTGIALAATTAPAAADSHVCGEGTSGKIDLGGGNLTVTIDIPAGKVLDWYCVKAGSAQQGEGPEINENDVPGPISITVGHASGKDLSHYSYALKDVPPEEPPPEEPPPEEPPPEEPPPEEPPPEEPPPEEPPPEEPPPEEPPAEEPPAEEPPAETTPPAEGEPVATTAQGSAPAAPSRIVAGVSGSADLATPASTSGSGALAVLGNALTGVGLALLAAAGFLSMQRLRRGWTS